ncbi:MAG TPA: hypothetical protein VEC93_04770 [Anaerolineae bacterium]|nr:hypothetical protein [Anaerolineae bacterium]
MTDNNLITVLSSMLEDLPQVSVENKVNHASFLVGKKVFAYTQEDGVVIKLPQEKIKELVGKKNAAPLVMGQRVMKEWVVIKHKDPEAYKEDIELFKEAIAFVSAKA